MILIDASVWIDFLNQKTTAQTGWLSHFAKQQVIGLTTLTLAEILQGIRTEPLFRHAGTHLQTFPVLNPATPQIALQSAKNYRTLRSKGCTIRSTVDCIVATYCIENGMHLLHNDRDFDAFERHLGLMVLHP